MRRTLGMALIVSTTLVAGATASAAGRRAEPRRYLVDQARATWVIPKQQEGRYRMYEVEAARYEDLGSGEVVHFATAERMECKGDGESLSCGTNLGPWRSARAEPSEFRFEDDLSAASVTFEVRGVAHRAEWESFDAATETFYFFPGTYERSEGCPQGSGAGHGLYRPMRAAGSTFGRELGPARNGSVTGIARFVLETECDPEDWWRAAPPLPAPGQWLRRADTSSFLSMLERPSMPTSLAFS